MIALPCFAREHMADYQCLSRGNCIESDRHPEVTFGSPIVLRVVRSGEMKKTAPLTK